MSADYLSENINDILSIARLAPSVHNTQPWKVKLTGGGLEISLDRQRLLSQGDPTGRQAVLSLGIFCEACIVSLEHFGLKASKPVFDGDKIFLKTTLKPAERDTAENVEAMKNRFTDRSVYKPVEVKESQLAKIIGCWQSDDVEVRAVSDRGIIAKTAKLTQQALLLAFSNPGFRQELTEHFVASRDVPYGIPVGTLGANPLKARLVKRLINSGLNRKQEAAAEYQKWASASALVFVLAGGDSKSYWLESGRAYMRAALEIEKLGLSQATSAAIVEAADFHEDIEKMLGTSRRIQSVIRIGKGASKKSFSGRLDPKEILIT